MRTGDFMLGVCIAVAPALLNREASSALGVEASNEISILIEEVLCKGFLKPAMV